MSGTPRLPPHSLRLYLPTAIDRLVRNERCWRTVADAALAGVPLLRKEARILSAQHGVHSGYELVLLVDGDFKRRGACGQVVHAQGTARVRLDTRCRPVGKPELHIPSVEG